eukprot:1376395-Pyramimonas_sp.AAC.1
MSAPPSAYRANELQLKFTPRHAMLEREKHQWAKACAGCEGIVAAYHSLRERLLVKACSPGMQGRALVLQTVRVYCPCSETFDVEVGTLKNSLKGLTRAYQGLNKGLTRA